MRETIDEALARMEPLRPAEIKADMRAKSHIRRLRRYVDKVLSSKPRSLDQDEWLFVLRQAASEQQKIAVDEREYGYQKKRKVKK